MSKIVALINIGAKDRLIRAGETIKDTAGLDIDDLYKQKYISIDGKTYEGESAPPPKTDKSVELSKIEALDEKSQKLLKKNGFETAEQVLEAGTEALLAIKGFGPNTAASVITACEEALV